MHLAIWFLGALLVAAPRPSAPRELTLDQALALARRQNLDLRIHQAQVDQAEGPLGQARSAVLPNLTVHGTFTYNPKQAVFVFPQPDGTFHELDLATKHQLEGSATLTIPVIAPGADARWIAASREKDAAEAASAFRDTSSLADVARAFYQAAGADEVVQARQHAVDVARQTVADAQARLDTGAAQPIDLDRANLALLRAQQDVVGAQAGQRAAYRNLSNLLQVDGPLQVVPPPSLSLPTESTDALTRNALIWRPDVVAADKHLRAAEAAHTAAALDWLPTVSLFGRVQAYNYLYYTGDKTAWALGAQLDWPLFDGALRFAQSTATSGQVVEAESNLKKARDAVAEQLADERDALDVQKANLEASQQAARISRDALSIARAQYQQGRSTQLDLLQAQDAVVAADLQLAQARYSLAVADIDFELAAGLFPPAGH